MPSPSLGSCWPLAAAPALRGAGASHMVQIYAEASFCRVHALQVQGASDEEDDEEADDEDGWDGEDDDGEGGGGAKELLLGEASPCS